MTIVTGPMRRGWLGQFPPWRRRRIICGARKLAFVYARSLVSVGRCSRFLGAWPGHMAIMHDRLYRAGRAWLRRDVTH